MTSKDSASNSPFLYPFDSASPLFVLKGILATGTFGAITGASIGALQSKNPYTLGTNMTINMSIAGLAFFTVREYLVSPLLLIIEATPSHSRRLLELQLSEKQRSKLPQVVSIGQMRTDRVLDSALAGALTGGALSAAFRGRATFGKAAFTSALITSALQASANQLRVMRLSYLAKSQAKMSSLDTAPSEHEPTAKFDALKSSTPAPDPTSPSLPERMMSSFTKILPVRKLSNEEYLATLEKKRADVDKRLKEIAEEEMRMYEWAQKQQQRPA
ncbi:hypothetical protein C349_03070 [Cryptococcus neoformans var. grubii Br795]|nr:hypothetical protein C368_00798 [Cryptococcus neoformans var. grubii 125.91]OXG82022.1 hypothetical protein C350_02916 [Cryptococcus neoformans var. grubii MW-RSA36]OXG83226.1 hypothetical protein C349_03070 [Cryptococcus neoformans var. grubii Br795]OXG88153.1 hypothetical protein C346_02995 [Cryptococcus neoformans var. grubii D17-1]OXG96778.1 hypothetical protein C345_02869 [Cryptococcus neoformans var. grubii A2-102-5]OXL09045.1 hypothetical protein C348_03153 [Cryptococcus neoformans v